MKADKLLKILINDITNGEVPLMNPTSPIAKSLLLYCKGILVQHTDENADYECIDEERVAKHAIFIKDLEMRVSCLETRKRYRRESSSRPYMDSQDKLQKALKDMAIIILSES